MCFGKCNGDFTVPNFDKGIFDFALCVLNRDVVFGFGFLGIGLAVTVCIFARCGFGNIGFTVFIRYTLGSRRKNDNSVFVGYACQRFCFGIFNNFFRNNNRHIFNRRVIDFLAYCNCNSVCIIKLNVFGKFNENVFSSFYTAVLIFDFRIVLDACFFDSSVSIFYNNNISADLAISVKIGNINVCRRYGRSAVFVCNIAFHSICLISENNGHILNRLILAIGNCSGNAVVDVN